MPRPVLSIEPANPADIWELPVGAVNIEHGDLISLESGTSVLMDAVAEDATFAGVSKAQKVSTLLTPSLLVVAASGVVTIDCASGTYTPMTGLKYSSENTLATADANTIAWVWRQTAASATRLKAYFNVPALNKLFANLA